MKDLYATAEKCINMLEDIGIHPTVTPSQFTVNTRATNRFGQVREANGRWYNVNINHWLLDDNSPQEGLENTVIHELLHTVDGCNGHTGKWLRLAQQVKSTYGYDIKRLSSVEEKLGENAVNFKKELAEKKAKRRANKPYPYKYEIVCEGCDAVSHRQRKDTAIKLITGEIKGYCTCTLCGSHKFKVTQMYQERGESPFSFYHYTKVSTLSFQSIIKFKLSI